MIIDRRKFLTGTATVGMGLVAVTDVPLADDELPVNEDGLHTQEWFFESFLDLKEDHQAAAEAGKHFAVIFEQRGCPYCRELHRVNFAKQEIRDYIQQKFVVLQLNLWGSREATDLDGKSMEERELARRWKVNFTPSMVFFPPEAEAVAGKSGGDSAIFRMPGYFKPFHFFAMLEFVADGNWRKENFQRFLQRRFEEARERGENPDVW